MKPMKAVTKNLFILSLLTLAACAGAKSTGHQTVEVSGNTLIFDSGTVNDGRYISVLHDAKPWQGDLAGGKEKWTLRRDALHANARVVMAKICGGPFFSINKKPIYRMLDGDETMGGAAPVLGIAASMLAYLATEAATKPTNIPNGVYIEFSCMSDEK